jgi:hypothetical protein
MYERLMVNLGEVEWHETLIDGCERHANCSEKFFVVKWLGKECRRSFSIDQTAVNRLIPFAFFGLLAFCAKEKHAASPSRQLASR